MLVSDDPSEASGWSDATGRGVLRWEWGECCSDGMVFGPLPTDSFCLNVRYSIPVEGLTSMRLFDYEDKTDTISHTEFGVDTMESGMQICPWPAEQLCQQHETVTTQPNPQSPRKNNLWLKGVLRVARRRGGVRGTATAAGARCGACPNHPHPLARRNPDNQDNV